MVLDLVMLIHLMSSLTTMETTLAHLHRRFDASLANPKEKMDLAHDFIMKPSKSAPRVVKKPIPLDTKASVIYSFSSS